ncbi:hypothetical protein AGLY_001813 [Aphis glycines]|uniref:Uncharacterized protein n=1 Tax=Aphis glycines TaxID=307491 RepID=A0A6G0U4X0_APHGL|nr:hypothetical protein AGLY_001813 [Aphis glycines]
MNYEHKKFYDFSTSKLLANFRVFDRFPTIKTTYKEPCIKFSKLFGHPKIFYRHLKKNFSKKIENFSVQQGYSLLHRKPPPYFEIGALFRLVMLYTDTIKNKKKKHTHIIVKSIHSSLRSESKIRTTESNLNKGLKCMTSALLCEFCQKNTTKFVKSQKYSNHFVVLAVRCSKASLVKIFPGKTHYNKSILLRLSVLNSSKLAPPLRTQKKWSISILPTNIISLAAQGPFSRTSPLFWACPADSTNEKKIICTQLHLTVPHPPYLFNLATCDFFIFSKLKRDKKGKCFTDNEEVKNNGGAGRHHHKRRISKVMLICIFGENSKYLQ